jgi:bifunctional DNA-binding transcriptional regulator/antitoxin component of YhaV-PrlF toxin-antitoxin module
MEQEVKLKRQRGYTRVSSKSQVTLPREALAKAGLKTGDRLRVDVNPQGQLVLSRPSDAVDRHAGALTGVYRPTDLDELRREWD